MKGLALNLENIQTYYMAQGIIFMFFARNPIHPKEIEWRS